MNVLSSLVRKRLFFIVALFVLAFTLRVAFLGLRGARLYFADSFKYHKIAESVLEGRGIELMGAKAAHEPGYPLFLAGCYAVFGRSSLPPRLIQTILGALTCVLIFFLGREVFNEETGRIAGLMSALYPFFIFFDSLILTESLFTFFMVLTLLGLVKLKKTGRWGMGILAGISAGVGSLIRSPFAMYLPFLAPFWLISSRRKRRAFLQMGLVLAVGLMVMMPWGIRNYNVLGHFVLTNTRGGGVLFGGSRPEAYGGPVFRAFPEEIDRLYRSLGEYEKDQLLRREGIRYIKAEPGRFLKLAFGKFYRTWNFRLNETIEGYAGDWRYEWISLCSYIVVPLALAGIWLSRRRWREWIVLVTPVLYFTLIAMVFIGAIRFRIPVMPYVILFAAYALEIGAQRIVEIVRYRHNRLVTAGL